ncbi:transporter substrate-binding domain-containing protein [Rheinheimera muenzenbergensis]|uniref:Transporter substrate-binding domain-containing protein n=1 Tax=Rheinheimera muenzenbergensis TaxID=1193628 RepID=A0ABU8C769_9GAMM
MPNRISLLFTAMLLSDVAAAQPEQLLWCLDHVPKRQHYEPGKTPYGPMVNLMQDLASRLNVELTFTLPTPVNRCLQQLEHGEVDIVASLLYSPQREQRFHLMPFDIARSESWFIHKDYQLQDQPGLRVMLVKDLIYSAGLQDNYKAAGYVITTANNMDEALAALFFRDTDIVVGPEHITQAKIANNARYKTILTLAPLHQQPVIEAHIAISKTGRYAKRHEAFRQALQQIRQEGKYALYN